MTLKLNHTENKVKDFCPIFSVQYSYPVGEISELYDNELDNKIEDNWERIHSEVDGICSEHSIKL